MKKVSEYRAEARRKLRGKWVDAAAFAVLWLTIAWLLGKALQVSTQMGWFFSFAPRVGSRGLLVLITMAATVGCFALLILANGPLHFIAAEYFMRVAAGKKADLSVFLDWKKNFAKHLAVTVYQLIFTIIVTFVLSMIVLGVSGLGAAESDEELMMLYSVIQGLLIAVALIVGLYFSQVWFVLVDTPKMDPWEAIKRSALLMCHHEGKFMLLLLSFAGWMLLAVLPMGLGLVFLLPYMEVSKALFYQSIRPNLLTTIKDVAAKAGRSVRQTVRKTHRRVKRK